jgi:hypothetical protein
MQPSFAELWIRTLTKADLRSLIEAVKCGDQESVSNAVVFVASESFGMWHNRARASLCRHFKNHPPSDDDRRRMVATIAKRLVEGRFSEQFKDQLAMAIRFDPVRLSEAANIASDSQREYIRRYADWVRNVLHHSKSRGE